MVTNWREIQHPLVRSMTVAVTVGSAVTLGAAVAIAATQNQTETAFKTGVSAALLGTGCGAVVGLVAGKSPRPPATTPVASAPAAPPPQGWQTWRDFVVVQKVKESEEITSFYLKPQDQAPLPDFLPGQFLPIRLEIPGQPQPVVRTYSLSDDPATGDYYRLSIKREPAPKDLDVPPGVASNFMHDQVEVGTVIQAQPPKGRFVLDVQPSHPVVLISNGVGITPMLSMVKACTRLHPGRPIWFIHGARNGSFHAFRDEVQAIATQHPQVQVHYCYSRPLPEDEGHYHSVGYVDAALIQSLVGPDAEFFLCGSPPFLQSLRQGLQAWGVPEQRVLFEAFGSNKGKTEPRSPSPTPSATTAATAEVRFARSGKTLTWRSGDGTLLEFAEANGIKPPFSCRAGVCGTCMCPLQEGEVEYLEPPTAEIEPGSVLICISQPKTPGVVLEL